ncbi:MAG: hypothetical protein QGG53_42365 [Planctomycetota bacterium]|nr:hypothetical protein [Planctomycetota bacterium]
MDVRSDKDDLIWKAQLWYSPSIDSLKLVSTQLSDRAISEHAAELVVALEQKLKLKGKEGIEAMVKVLEKTTEVARDKTIRDAATKLLLKYRKPDLDALNPDL